MAQLVDAMSDRAREFGIKEAMLIALAKRYAEGNPENFDAALAELERALEFMSGENESRGAKSNIFPDLDYAIKRINTQNESGDFEGAQKILNAEVEAVEAKENQLNAIRSRLYEIGVAQAIFMRDADQVCHFVLAGINMSVPDPKARHLAHRMAIQEWSMRGESLGLKFDLEVAERLARSGAENEVFPLWIALMNFELGRVLCTLGQIEFERERLDASIETSRIAAKQFNRLGLKVEWAHSHVNIGSALHSLGRFSPIHFKEAEKAFEAALTVLTRKFSPDSWAGLQSNLGNVYHSLASIEGDTAKTEQAIAAHKSALEEISLEKDPEHWVSVSLNLGITFVDLASQIQKVEYAREAEVILSEVQKVAADNALLQLSARAQNYLGLALSQIGQIIGDVGIIDDAAPQFERALNLQTPEDTPRDWARTQMSIGGVELERGLLEACIARLEKAVVAFRAALGVLTETNTPNEWTGAQLGLGQALDAIGRRKRNTVELREAVTAFECARRYIRREDDEDRWTHVTIYVAETQHLIAERDNDAAELAKAAENYAELQIAYTRERSPIEWAEIQSQLGRIFVVQGHADESSDLLQEGISALRDAYKVLTVEDGKFQWSLGHASLGNGLVCLGRLEDSAGLIEQGVSAFRAALTPDLCDVHPKIFTKLHLSIGSACADLCKRVKDKTHKTEAIAHIEIALEVSRKIGEIELTKQAEQGLQEITALLKD